MAWEVLADQEEGEDVTIASSQYSIHEALEDPIAFAASSNPDILYWDQVMKAHDRDKFIEAVGVELDGQEKMGNKEPILLREIPKRHETHRHGMVNAAQEAHQQTRGLQVEGPPECPWRATGTRHSLLGYLRPSCDLANGPPVFGALTSSGLAEPSTRFRHGLPPSTGRDAALHAAAAGIPTSRND